MTARIDSSTVNGSVSVKTAGGLAALAYNTAFVLRNDSTIQGTLTIRTGDSDDAVLLDGALIVKGLNIDTGTGTSAVAIHGCGIGGERVGGKLITYNSTISQSASGWSLGSDTTAVSITSSEFGALTLKLGPQNSSVLFDHSGVVRTLLVSGQGGDDVFTFDRCRMLGNVAVKTAGGNDTVRFNGVEMSGGALSIDAGAGVDSVRMDTGTGSVLGEYAGPVRIALGAGEDILQMGNPTLTGNRGHYEKPVTLSGGSGADGLYYVDSGSTFVVQPKPDLFETILLLV